MLDQSFSDIQKKQGTRTQIIKKCFPDDLDVFDKRAATGAEREEVASTIASASAQATVGEDYEDDLDSVDADEDAEYEAFLEELYSPSL